MLLAKVTKNDVVYDPGSGDGRIPITAAKAYRGRAVGIDIDPQRIREANENLKIAGVGDRVKFLNQDLFTTDISEPRWSRGTCSRR
jgi:tRNA1(Val) A37 N6-methylase TrmN6